MNFHEKWRETKKKNKTFLDAAVPSETRESGFAMSVQLGDGPTRQMAQEGASFREDQLKKHLNHLKPENMVEKNMTNDGLPWILPTLHLDEL